MTDSTNATNDALESLVAGYESAVSNIDTGDATALLNMRSDLESRWSDLSAAQVQRVEDADAYIVQNSGQVASRLAAAGTSLRELRAATPKPSEHWWWYLDVVSHVSEELTASAPSQSSLFSKIITIVELIVLAVAIFLLARNFIPQLQGGGAASSSTTGSQATAFPSWTPGPTATSDPSAFDMSSAVDYKSPDNVVAIKIPKPWKATPAAQPGSYAYTFTYGETADAVTLQVVLDDAEALYQSFLGLTTKPTSPEEALKTFKANPPNPQLTFADVKAGKVGKLDASTVLITLPAGPQGGEATNIELRIAPVEGGKVVLALLQAPAASWDKVYPVLGQIVDTLVVSPASIPTSTPTNTPHPLELTATAIQNLAATNFAEIQALTPSPTLVATEAATAAATGDASGSSSAATAPAASAVPTATP
jgi:hypothetical protein